MERKILAEITHNMRVKVYPDGTKEYSVASSPIYREPGWESEEQACHDRASVRDGSDEDLIRSKRRAVAKLREIALSNDFKYFVTLTLDASKIDRYDVSVISKKLNNWLDNRVRRNGLKYCIVPEYHKDSAIHFHGFINDVLPVVSSGTFTCDGWRKPKRPRNEKQKQAWIAAGAHEVFNLPAWPFGFTTAIELYGDKFAAVGYVCKYISKSDDKIGGRWYYSGGSLDRPVCLYSDVCFDSFVAVDNSSRYTITRINTEVITWIERPVPSLGN